MVGIKGLGGVQEQQSDRPAKVRDEKARDAARADLPKDGVLISSEAQAAATLAQTIKDIGKIPDIRTERVEAARESIERGDYKRPEIVAEVAKRISKYLP